MKLLLVFVINVSYTGFSVPKTLLAVSIHGYGKQDRLVFLKYTFMVALLLNLNQLMVIKSSTSIYCFYWPNTLSKVS